MARYGEQRFWDLSPSALTFGRASTDEAFRADPHFKRTPQGLLNREKIESNIIITVINSNNESLEQLRVQTVPTTLNVAGDSNFEVIPSIGRNNPFYHYTGSEDSLTFELDWYSIEGLRQDVIRKCRWVRSLTKSDGYNLAPPRIVLTFGHLFTNEQWIVESAPYRLELFDKEQGMFPRQAYQQITLKRVTDHNLTREELIRVEQKPYLRSPFNYLNQAPDKRILPNANVV